MYKFILRITTASLVAIAMATIGIVGNPSVLQTLFTVLGIVFSISMSLLVSFSLSKILNGKIRNLLRVSISHTRNMLLLDFGATTLVLVVALLWNDQHLNYTICQWIKFDVMLTSVTVTAVSLAYEIYNFRKLHRLHTDIEDAIISEETAANSPLG